MVWGLLPVDNARGVQKYYIFSKGSYKVGRKDCDVVVQTDTSISREHAEIVVDKMTSLDPSKSKSMTPSCVRIIDRSKFGTTINKDMASKATQLKKNQEIMLTDGDSVTFGTSNATFRFSYVPLIIFLHCMKSTPLDSVLQATVSNIGAYATNSWSSECTHVVVEKSSPVTPELIQAVLARNHIVLSDWLKVFSERSIYTEIPSCTMYVPDLSLDGTLVKVVEPNQRDKVLEGYSFVLGSYKYKFGDMLQSLLKLVGARCLSADEFSSNSQTSADGENNQFILVVPITSADEFNPSHELSSLVRVVDVKLVAVILSGQLDVSIFKKPPYVVSSSHSTDETVVAASDTEMDTAASGHAYASSKPQVAISQKSEDLPEHRSESQKVPRSFKNRDNINEDYENLIAQRSEGGKVATSHDNKESDSISTIPSKNVSDSRTKDGVIEKLVKNDESVDRHENSDIIYSQDLIVRNSSMTIPLRSTSRGCVNFKCFRKKEIVSGNSFKDLIPFSKDPYRQSDCTDDLTSEYIKEEKKRKQFEAIAEDLFNNDKGRKRAAAGASIYSLFTQK